MNEPHTWEHHADTDGKLRICTTCGRNERLRLDWQRGTWTWQLVR